MITFAPSLTLTNSKVFSVPNPTNPRLLFPDHGIIQRWRYSGLYPASRISAKAYRLFMRVRAAMKLFGQLTAIPAPDNLKTFVQDCFRSEVPAGVVLIGAPGPTQKLVVQLWGDGKVLGYMKFGKTSTARSRIEREYTVLSGLAANLGPRPLKLARFVDGVAMIIRPIYGKQLPASISSLNTAKKLLSSMTKNVTYLVHEHPWMKDINERHRNNVTPCLDALSEQTWPVVFQHGDFAPWNVFQDNSGILRAIDWEHGTLEGFPYLDQAFFLLQVGRLINRWSPEKAKKYAESELGRELKRPQAEALIRLVALDTYDKMLEDGHDPNSQAIRWWWIVWKERR
jgi:hypothetical protein